MRVKTMKPWKRVALFFAGGVALAALVFFAVFAYLYFPPFNPYSGYYSDLDDDFYDSLASANQANQEYLFRGVVPFEWDTVSVFGEFASAEEISDETGVPILRGSSTYQNSRALMVFCLGGHVVDVHNYRYANLILPPNVHTYSREVLFNGSSFREPSGLRIEANCT